MKPNLEKAVELKKIEEQKIQSLKNSIKRLKATSHTTIQGILADECIPASSKSTAIVYAALNNQLDLEDIENHLRNYSNKQDTKYRRLLVVYDYLKYGPKK